MGLFDLGNKLNEILSSLRDVHLLAAYRRDEFRAFRKEVLERLEASQQQEIRCEHERVCPVKWPVGPLVWLVKDSMRHEPIAVKYCPDCGEKLPV